MSSTSTQSPPAATKPSKVLHFRNVLAPITQSELLEVCQQVGPVEYIMMLPNSNQAFVQFESQTSATTFLNQAARYPVKIQNITLYVQYSVHDSIQQKQTARVEGTPSRVLLVTIHNPLYPVTIDVLSQIFNREKVEKIIIFQKRSGLQALIQFKDIESATAAMRSLDGKNIYRSCCTLQIQYSKQTELSVVANSDRTHDFTNPKLPERHGKSFLPSSQLMGSYGGMPDVGYSNFQAGVPGMMQTVPGMSMGAPPMGGMGGVVGVPQMYRSVVIVNGFPPDQIGCDQLFNLFSNYGNIVRIKILHDKPNTALVQFTDYLMASNAVQYLKDVVVCGSKLSVNFSKFPTISPSREIRQQMLSGGHYDPTNSEGRASADGRTVEYEESSLNRYLTNLQTNLRHVTAPTQYLHVYSLASTVTEESLSHFMERIAKPVAVKLFEKSQRVMALVQMPSVELAVNAMCFLHNEVLDGRHIRLAFTKSRL